METFHQPPHMCPWCGDKLDAATPALGQSAPTPGDLSMCLNCGHFLVFAPDMSLRELRPGDLKDAPTEVLETMQKVRIARSLLPGAGGTLKPRQTKQ